jgi:hypothetical protein
MKERGQIKERHQTKTRQQKGTSGKGPSRLLKKTPSARVQGL